MAKVIKAEMAGASREVVVLPIEEEKLEKLD